MSTQGAQDLEADALARMPLGDAIHLLLHRAGIGVDVEGDGLEQRVTNLRSIRVAVIWCFSPAITVSAIRAIRRFFDSGVSHVIVKAKSKQATGFCVI